MLKNNPMCPSFTFRHSEVAIIRHPEGVNFRHPEGVARRISRVPILTAFIFFFIYFVGLALANDLAITGSSLVNKLSGANPKTWDIQFTASWDNSWCDTGAACNGTTVQTQTGNWDAAWVFAKFSKWNAASSAWSDWAHCTLAKDNAQPNAEHTAPVGAKLKTGCSPSAACGGGDIGTGVFLYHNTAGTFSAAGSNLTTFANARMRWQYSLDGVADSDVVKIRVFGVEMVYIPAGKFYAGDYATSTASLKKTAASANPWTITSEAALSVDNALYYYVSNGNGGEAASGTTFTIPAAFPKGYGAFYIMKYELSQGMYRDFLNSLNRTGQNVRTAAPTVDRYVMSDTAFVNYRNGLRAPAAISVAPIIFGCDLEGMIVHNTTAGDKVFNEANDGEWVAVNYVSWADNAAFADWAALRPFTELEYEKAARGPQIPVAGEYAWGNTTLEAATTTLNASSGTRSELPNQGNMNYDGSSPDGPFRSGSYAVGAGSRQNAGASYYGVMDLSGNLWERPVTVGNATGRSFTGLHGNGVLSAGNADVTFWPGTDAQGAGFRGGSWLYTSVYARVSDRSGAAYTSSYRYFTYGVRVSRTSP